MTASTQTKMDPTMILQSTVAAKALSVQLLKKGKESEVLAFLAERPLHTFVMAGHIRDNGLESDFNRGTFYACRNNVGGLEGVALIGHATLLETRSEAALAALAREARSHTDTHLIMGEQEMIGRFWRYFATEGQSPRRVGHESLFELRRPNQTGEPVSDLRLATLEDIEPVMLVQDEMAFTASGTHPLTVDAIGFRLRCARRIDKKRVWVLVQDGRLIFKADIISETPEVMYLEGIYVNPQDRGRGFGTHCMSQLSRTLLQRTDSLCLFINEESRRARPFFERIGFGLRSRYDTIFL